MLWHFGEHAEFDGPSLFRQARHPLGFLSWSSRYCASPLGQRSSSVSIVPEHRNVSLRIVSVLVAERSQPTQLSLRPERSEQLHACLAQHVTAWHKRFARCSVRSRRDSPTTAKLRPGWSGSARQSAALENPKPRAQKAQNSTDRGLLRLLRAHFGVSELTRLCHRISSEAGEQKMHARTRDNLVRRLAELPEVGCLWLTERHSLEHSVALRRSYVAKLGETFSADFLEFLDPMKMATPKDDLE